MMNKCILWAPAKQSQNLKPRAIFLQGMSWRKECWTLPRSLEASVLDGCTQNTRRAPGALYWQKRSTRSLSAADIRGCIFSHLCVCRQGLGVRGHVTDLTGNAGSVCPMNEWRRTALCHQTWTFLPQLELTPLLFCKILNRLVTQN